MVLESPNRAATTLRHICNAALPLGIAPSICLEGTGVTPEDLDNPHSVHSTAQELRAIENFLQHAPDNPVGLGAAVGRNMHENAFGIWGFAILTSPTLRFALQTSIEYEKLSLVIAQMSLTEKDGLGRIRFDMTGLSLPVRRFILEKHATIGMNFLRQMLQQPNYSDFGLETPDTDRSYLEALSKIMTIPVTGAMADHAVTFPAALLDRALPKSDPVSLKFCLDQCDAQIARIHENQATWSRKVHDAILDDIGSEQKIEDIATKLAVTERTLRRRLTEEGTSFRELYTDARMVIAHELLQVANLNVESVSWRVGYAEPASFARAFAKKYGKTPGEVRKGKDLPQAG